jgi:predicted RNA binding protein YcfA (HicA-like mRNA interferase family)
MSKKRKLLDAIRNNPAGVRFSELVRLLEALGYRFDRKNGTSHTIYVHDTAPTVNVQSGNNGMAKRYQVVQVLDIVDDHNLEVK